MLQIDGMHTQRIKSLYNHLLKENVFLYLLSKLHCIYLSHLLPQIRFICSHKLGLDYLRKLHHTKLYFFLTNFKPKQNKSIIFKADSSKAMSVLVTQQSQLLLTKDNLGSHELEIIIWVGFCISDESFRIVNP